MPETIGQRLKKAREYRNLTLEKAEDATRIRAQFLQALEADDFASIPSPVQARGFLRNYAEYLGLDLDAIVEELRQAEAQKKTSELEIIFEGETPQIPEMVEEQPAELFDEAQKTDEKPDSSSWKNWIKRLAPKSTLDENPASETTPEPAPAVDAESMPGGEDALETEAGPKVREGAEKLWLAGQAWLKSRMENKPEVPVEVPPEGDEDVEEQPAPTLPESSQAIFDEIGGQLFKRRTMLSLTRDEIERHTKMRAVFLGALEEGRMEDLPSPVQTRGMLSNYAQFLDLDVDALLLRFAEALQAQHRERHPEKPARRRGQPIVPEKLPVWRTFIAGDLVFGIGTVILMVVFAIWGIARVINVQSEQAANAEATAPSISDVLIDTVGSQTAPAVFFATVTQPGLPEGTLEIPTQDFNVAVQVNIIAVGRTYLRVLVDGEEKFNSRVVIGNAYAFEGQESIEVLAGNAAALRLVHNQRDLGLMGSFGQLVHNIYTADTVITPTPLASPTITNTPFVTPTPSPTLSPTPSATVTPTTEE